ncbi:MAG: hypothetical protein Q4A32_05435 [Lachnospiraceae bacterium]|nr:hypothetical protein [Lachnospiraceae bacterium]
MDATDIIQCGMREQKRMAVLADGICKVIAGHDSSVPEMTGTGADEIRGCIARLNSERARVGMEVKMLVRYRDELRQLLKDLERETCELAGCEIPELREISAERRKELALSQVVHTQTAAAAEQAIRRYGDYAEALKNAAKGMQAALVQSAAADYIRIFAAVREAAEACRIEE